MRDYAVRKMKCVPETQIAQLKSIVFVLMLWGGKKINKHLNVPWMRMDHWGFCGLSPPIITPQAGIRDGLIALQAILENGGSFLESQAIRSTFSTQSTPISSTLLSEWSRNKERDICWMSVQLSASVVPQPDALWTGRTIHPSQSTDLQVGRSPVVNLPTRKELWPLDSWRPHRYIGFRKNLA